MIRESSDLVEKCGGGFSPSGAQGGGGGSGQERRKTGAVTARPFTTGYQEDRDAPLIFSGCYKEEEKQNRPVLLASCPTSARRGVSVEDDRFEDVDLRS